MKNHSIIAPIYMPAELRPEEFATFLAAFAAWATKDPENLEAVFQMYREDTKSEDSTSQRMKFASFFFFECKAGSDLFEALRKGRQASRPLATGHQQHNEMPTN